MCVGLDPLPELLPAAVKSAEDPVFEFNRRIVDATIDLAPVYKPNLAFYEALGVEGWRTLKHTIDYIGDRAIVLGDSKRGDIDNTAIAYAKAMFEVLGLGASTVTAYIGHDAVAPFLNYRDRGVFVLCRTSNKSAAEIQDRIVEDVPLYLRLAQLAVSWNEAGNCALVVGATAPSQLASVREIAPMLPILIPGVGAQGGDLDASVAAARRGPFIVNSSRGIIYASPADDFADAARAATMQLRDAIAAAKTAR